MNKEGAGSYTWQTYADVSRGTCDVSGVIVEVYYLITQISICTVFYCALPIPLSLSLAILAFSVLSIHLHHSPQSLPLSAAGYREGEGKPGGADRALFQGAAWTGSLWQHQERRHTRPNVSKLR